MSLNSLQDDMSRRAASMAAMAKRSNNPQDIQAIQNSLVAGVQSGSIQPYVGIPLIQELTQRLTEAKAQMAQSMAGMQQPQQGQQDAPIAQQVMQQAAQEGQGLEALPSNLPQEYAGGGIIAFANTGLVDSNAGEEEAQYAYEEELAKRQQANMNPKSMQDFVTQYQGLMTAIPKGASQTEYEDYLKNRSGGAEATKTQDLNLALAQFGLNLAAGKSQNALENIGEAGIKSLPAVQEAYKQRRLADETALRGRAELDRMSRAEQIETLKGGMGLYGDERKLSADAEKADLQRKNALAVARAQKEGKSPTDLINYVNDYVASRQKAGDQRSLEALKIEGYNNYPGYDVRRQIAGIQAGVAGAGQAVITRGQDLDAAATAIKEFNDLPRDHPTRKAFKAAARKDVKNAEQGIVTNEADTIMRDYINKVTPGAKPAAAAPVASPVAGPSALPKGSRQVGTSGGKPVYETPDGKRFIQN